MSRMTLQQEQLLDDLRRDRKTREAIRRLTVDAVQLGVVCGFLFGAALTALAAVLVLR